MACHELPWRIGFVICFNLYKNEHSVSGTPNCIFFKWHSEKIKVCKQPLIAPGIFIIKKWFKYWRCHFLSRTLIMVMNIVLPTNCNDHFCSFLVVMDSTSIQYKNVPWLILTVYVLLSILLNSNHHLLIYGFMMLKIIKLLRLQMSQCIKLKKRDQIR